MAEDRPEDTGPAPESARPKRNPPTIDLEATEVSSETRSAPDAAAEAAGSTFTKNDVNFLRSLRISIEGEDSDELTAGEDETKPD